MTSIMECLCKQHIGLQTGAVEMRAEHMVCNLVYVECQCVSLLQPVDYYQTDMSRRCRH